MIVPSDEGYSERDYLVDAGRALGHKIRYEHRSYWPPYHGIKVAWSWPRFAGRVAHVTFWVGVTYGVLWMVGR